jgi:hypothetical protein
LVAAATRLACADDFGPHGDVSEVRFAAQRLLAHTARGWKADPNNTRISDVVVVKNAALLSWDIGASHGLMGLIRQYDRWWDALEYRHNLDGWIDSASYPLAQKCSLLAHSLPNGNTLLEDGLPRDLIDAALAHNADLQKPQHVRAAGTSLGGPIRPSIMIDRFCDRRIGGIAPTGGTLWQIPSYTSGYDITIAYSRNDARTGTSAKPLYARPPTLAEIIPYPTTMHFISTAVLYFDLTLEGSAPITFQPGTTIDIWFPFLLDDALSYDLTIGFADRPIGPIYSKPFDNVLHYKLPGFTVAPGRALMAEIDGNWP